MGKTVTIKKLARAGLVVQLGNKDSGAWLHQEFEDLFDAAHVHSGDLGVQGLSVDRGVLVVTGNLSVDDEIHIDETGSLVVGGSLTCRSIYLEGSLAVQGDLVASGVIYGFYEAGMTRVMGTARSQLFLMGNYDWEAEAEDHAVMGTFSNFDEWEEGDPKKVRQIMGKKPFGKLKPLFGLDDEGDEDGNDAWGLKCFRHLNLPESS